ncbi:MAG: hypothetical protein NT136_02495 [Candidatus Moranbacteria bacterium]|nr:hypothetical protein [Candidatus Moranbacteria bacterium]
MRKNKKVYLFALAPFLFLGLIPFLASAQTGNSGMNASPTEIQIKDIKLGSGTVKAGEKLTGSFTLVNNSGQIVSDLRYKMRLFEKPAGDTGKGYIDNTPRVPIDTQISPDFISLGILGEKNINFSYVVPLNLQSGEHLFLIEAFRSSGTMASWKSAKITVTDASGKYLSISDTKLLANGTAAGSPIEGVSVDKGDKIEAAFTVENKTDLKNVKIKTQVYYRDTLLEKLKEETQDLAVSAGKSNLTIVLPQIDKPGGSYLARIQIIDLQTNEAVSNEVYFRWVVKGVSAKILSVSLASSQGEIGKKALTFAVSYAGPADMSNAGTGTLSVDIKNGGEILSSAKKDIRLSGTFTENVAIDLSNVKPEKLAAVLSAEAKISKDNSTLDSYSVKLNPSDLSSLLEGPKSAPVEVEKAKGKMTAGKIAAVGALVLVLIISALVIWKIRKRQNVMLIFVFIGTLALASAVLLGFSPEVQSQDYPGGGKGCTDNSIKDYGDNPCFQAEYTPDYFGLRLKGDRNGDEGHFIITDSPITFPFAPSDSCRIFEILKNVNYVMLPKTVHSSFNEIQPMLNTGSQGQFSGDSRYIYFGSIDYIEASPGCYMTAGISHTVLPARSSQVVMDFYYYNSSSGVPEGLYLTEWGNPVPNSSFGAGNPITFSGMLSNNVCENGSATNLDNLQFSISSEQFSYTVEPYGSSESGIVSPSSLSAVNYYTFPSVPPGPSSNDYFIYDITFLSFPGSGDKGTAPGSFSNGNLYAYLMAYGRLNKAANYIKTIAHVPIQYQSSTTKLCVNACDSGILIANESSRTMTVGQTLNLKACHNLSSACDDASGDITYSNLVFWSDNNTPNNAVSLSGTNPKVLTADNPGSEGVSMRSSASSGYTVNFTVNVSSLPVCVCNTGCEASICKGTNCNDSCGNSVCPGTKNCGPSWKEVAP